MAHIIYINAPANSQGAHKLAFQIDQLGAPLKISAVIRTGGIPADAYCVNWGLSRAASALNRAIVGNKFEELRRLRDAGIRVPEFQRERPRSILARDVNRVAALRASGWLKRTDHHARANDLRYQRSARADYWVRKLEITEEFRIHVFRNKVIRAALKMPGRVLPPGSRAEPANGELPAGSVVHPWIRSWEAGWKMAYGRVARERLDALAAQTIELRRASREACRALGYDFGAVDVGVADGLPVVLEVNSRPGLDGDYTATAYAKAILINFKKAKGLKEPRARRGGAGGEVVLRAGRGGAR